ncbi:MAG: metal ABC transporter ATP-binding protein [Treponema sp.]|jgi:zinc transport system ATP-binding protein|nr:metal ABC transporter ATP-binding protein [Treponema sp.]
MLISCNNVSLGYEGHAVVRDISFTVENGDYLLVVGENGSGKSTLIKGLLKLLSPLEGSIVFCDELAGGRIGYLSQQSAAKKDFPASVYEIVLSGNLSGMGLRPFYSPKEKRQAEEAMEQLGIKDLAKKCYRELSGGQQRRVLLARALVTAAEKGGAKSEKPSRLLVLDEPAAGLDPLVTVEVYDLLKTLNQQKGITIISVSHDIRGAAQYANRVLHIENGNGFFSGIDEYLSSDRGRKFLGQQKEKA